MSALIGEPPICVKCRKRWVSTVPSGYNMTCDECINAVTTDEDEPRQPWQDRYVTCPVETCQAGAGVECLDIKGRPMLHAHNLRRDMSQVALEKGEGFD